MTQNIQFSYRHHRSMLKLQVMWMIEDGQIPQMTDEQIEEYLNTIHGHTICVAIDNALKQLVEDTITIKE